jgi:hypothetical protein
VSDIGILNDPISLIAIALIFGSPGLLLGGIPGALLWRSHRVAGALSGRGRRLHPLAGRMDVSQGRDLSYQILSRSMAGDPSTESKIYPRLRP